MIRKLKTGYGIDLADNHLTLVRSVRRRGQVHSEVLIDDEHLEGNASTWQRLKDRVLREQAAGRCNVAAAMAVRDSFTRWLETPFTSPAKAKKVLPSLLDIRLPFPLESCTYAFLDQRKGEDRHIDVLAVAARTEQVQRLLAACEPLGCRPSIIDHEGLALWSQSVHELSLERGALRIVAWIGHDRTALVLGDHERFVSAHGYRIGASDLGAEDAQGERRLLSKARQLLRSLGDPAQRDMQWIWTGPAVRQDESLAFLESGIGELAPLHFGRHKDAATFLPRALSRRALGSAGPACNFLAGAGLASPSGEDAPHRAKRLAAGFLVLGLVLCVLNLGWLTLLNAKKTAMQEELSSLAAELSGLPRVPKGQEVIVVERALRERRDALAPFVEGLSAPTASLLAELVRAARDARLTLETVSLQANTATVRGSAEGWAHPEALAGVLERAGLVADLSREDAGADERVHFSIEGSRDGN